MFQKIGKRLPFQNLYFVREKCEIFDYSQWLMAYNINLVDNQFCKDIFEAFMQKKWPIYERNKGRVLLVNEKFISMRNLIKTRIDLKMSYLRIYFKGKGPATRNHKTGM